MELKEAVERLKRSCETMKSLGCNTWLNEAIDTVISHIEAQGDDGK